MSKLLNLKQWLTIKDAARHLSILFGEDVGEADILRLGLDKKLQLSVNLVNHATVKRQKIIPISEARTVSVYLPRHKASTKRRRQSRRINHVGLNRLCCGRVAVVAL